MSGAGFILAINFFVAALFALAFFLVAATNRSDSTARWFAAAYLFGLLYLGCEFLQPLQSEPRFVYSIGFAAFFSALATITMGIAGRFRAKAPCALIAVVFTVSIVANFFAFELGRDSMLRMFAYQAPYAFMQGLCAWIVFRSSGRKGIDVALLAVFGFSALHFLSKPLVAFLTGGTGATAQAYISSDYALFSQSFGAVLQVGIGLLMLLLVVRDMLVDITAKSETDALSGLFNRRGFEQRAEPALAATRKAGLPAAMVICDLDHFKAVNDGYGHDMGDRVIEVFAGILKKAAAETMVVARMGGEEFTVFLPGSNAAGARLFAEGVRNVFAHMPIAGFPERKRCTASFGVAESQADESLSDLRRRADAALYAAKRTGRDRVSVADAALDAMPRHPYDSQPYDKKITAGSL